MSLAALLHKDVNADATNHKGDGGVASSDALQTALFRTNNVANYVSPAERLKQKALAKSVKPPEAVIEAALLARQKSSISANGSQKQRKQDVNPEGTGTGTGSANKTKKRKRGDDARTTKTLERHASIKSANDSLNDDADASSDGDDTADLVHETLRSADSKVKTAKSRTRDTEPTNGQAETTADRNARTTFVGNVPIACATNKAFKKALIRHLTAALPSQPSDLVSVIRLDSIRFRSLQLAEPVSANDGTRQQPKGIAGDDDEAQDADGISRSMRRARRWREGDEAGDTAAQMHAGKQKFLTASQKRKVAFITGDIHQKATSCNAYAVWTSSDAAVASAADLARAIVAAANNTTFEGHTLRVDAVSPPRRLLTDTDSSKDVRASASEKRALLDEEKRTLFLGGLDFEEEEQSIRALCEQLLSEERGEASATSPNLQGWVERVRVVKDSASGLGKGFAYVIFADRECVDTMLALDAARVKLSKRKLRMERCRSTSLAAAAKKVARASTEKAMSANSKSRTRAIKPSPSQSAQASVVPARIERRPDVGESLRQLSKDDRKAIKSTDAERLARRLQKKEHTKVTLKAERAKASIDASLRKTAASKPTIQASARKTVAKTAKQDRRRSVGKASSSRPPSKTKG